MSKEKCGKCSKAGTKDVITCGICSGVFHYKCMEITVDIYNAIVVNSNIFWFCNNCLTDIKGCIKNVVDLKNKHDELDHKQILCNQSIVDVKEQIDQINSRLMNIECQYDKLVSADKNIDSKLNEIKNDLNKSWSDVVKGEVQKSVTTYHEEINSAKQTINSAVQELKNNMDAQSRENNIVIFRLKESANSNKDESYKEDKASILHIVSRLTDGEVREKDIKKFYRLGVKNENVRPIKIEFWSKTVKNLIMENLSKLKDMNETQRSIGVSHDMTNEQREKCKLLVEEAKKKQSNDSGEFLYRVRGDPSNLKILRIKRK